MLDSLAQLTVTWALALLFAAAFVHKARSGTQWAGALDQYRLLPEQLVVAGALLLPVLELLTAGLLLWSRTRAAGSLTGGLLLLVYAGALAINLRRGRTALDCGCFGSQSTAIAPWMVGRNLLLVLLCCTLLLPVKPRMLSPLECAYALVFVATLALLYPVLEIALQPAPPTFDDNARASGARPTARC